MRNMIAAAAVLAGALAVGVVTAPAASAATNLGGVDMQAGCNNQYPGWGLQAKPLNRYDVYSWRCVAPFDNSSYGIDINRQCAKQYGNPGTGDFTNRYDAYSWYCRR